MYCDSPEADLGQRSEVFLVYRHLLQVVQRLPSIYYPVLAYIQNNCRPTALRLWVTHLPNIVYFMSRCGCLEYVMKNWEPFVSGPWFAIETTPLLLCYMKYGTDNAR